MKIYCPNCNKNIIKYSENMDWTFYDPIPYFVHCECGKNYYREDILEFIAQELTKSGLNIIKNDTEDDTEDNTEDNTEDDTNDIKDDNDE